MRRFRFADLEAGAAGNRRSLSREIIEGAEQGIIGCDALRYLVFNPFMQKLTGKRAEEVVGRHVAEVFPGLHASGQEQLLLRALHGEVVHAAACIIAPAGQHREQVAVYQAVAGKPVIIWRGL